MVWKFINIDSAALKEVKEVTGLRSDREAVHRALSTHARMMGQSEALEQTLAYQRTLRDKYGDDWFDHARADPADRQDLPLS